MIRKVLMTADTLGGVWAHALELARALGSRGIETTLATLGRLPTRAQQCEADAIPSITLRATTFKLEWMPDCWTSVEESGKWLQRLEKEVEPDLVHLNTMCHGSLPWAAPSVVVAHSCVASWWESVKREPLPAKWTRYTSQVGAGLHAADAVVVPSRYMAAAVERHYGVSDVQVVPNGCASDGMFVPGELKEPIIFAAGRIWDEGKNLARLDRACKRVSWPLYIAGDATGPDGERLAPHHAVALGRLSARAVAAWLRCASIYALPAKYEPFGLSVLEAALSGCALVLGDIASLRENWADTALFVDPDDETAMASALSTLASSAALRAELGRRARDRAVAFSRERMTLGYTTIYDRLSARCLNRADRRLQSLHTV